MKEKNVSPSPPIVKRLVILPIIAVLAVQIAPTVSAKCIGYNPPPNGGGGPTGSDYFGIALDVGSLAFFVAVVYLILRSRRKNKPSSPDKQG